MSSDITTSGAAGVQPAASPPVDPILDVDGAFFPAWMLCMILGIALTFAFYPLFVRMGIEPYIGPPVLIYPSLALLLTLLIWLVFFRT